MMAPGGFVVQPAGTYYVKHFKVVRETDNYSVFVEMSSGHLLGICDESFVCEPGL